ncbi:hypothetical protein GGR54DRAFT_636637 [Hypoxylon sp. NC1633]|nr:hypothetical protein GGR54DRAFT_636637 [Hypoxylon sp. NC1633]
MAHLAPSQTAIFSPSVARAAASTAKDWSYVDNWLQNKYAGSSFNRGKPPSFERNPETLKALLALAAANEAADEDREQLARFEESALDEVRAAERHQELKRKQAEELVVPGGEAIVNDLLAAIRDGLTKEGKTALDSMAAMAVELGVAHASPEALGAKYVELQGRAFEVDDAFERVNLLQQYLVRESARMDAFIDELQRGGAYQLKPDLARQNLELQRKIKSVATGLPELRQQIIALEKSIGVPGLAVEEVREDEEAYLELLARKKGLDAQVKAFAGLPPDIEAARVGLDALRTELRDATEQRDANFEKLVERESPAKNRRKL